jgi:7-cyano-7-deazaguanine synthase
MVAMIVEKCVVVISGGVDSSTVAYWVKDKGFDIYAITYRYGQIAEKEVKHAAKIADSLEIPIKIIDISSLKDIFTGVTSLCDENIKMTSSFSEPIIVPFRNAILLSIAVSYAVSLGATKVFYGAQGSDESFYPDCRRVFFKSFEKTSRLGTGVDVMIEAPFSSLSKSEVIKLGTKLGVPYQYTWSCYLSGEKHCGECESCINRIEAFEKAGIRDSMEYLKP